MTLTASLTLCQYCEHANPADAKFCTGCGAPLHLIPCPQCGAVNQKTSKTCYQCHGQLRESTEILLADAPATASEEAAGNAESTAMSSPYTAQPPVPQRQPVYVIAIILVAFAAAAYFAYQQRSIVVAKEAAVAASGAINKSVVAPLPRAPVPAAAQTPAPAVAEKNIVTPPVTTAVVPLPATADLPPESAGQSNPQTGAVRKSGSRRRAEAEAANSPTAPAALNSERLIPGIRTEKTPLRTAPCTEAVAALGLCTPAPTKGNP